MQNHLNQADRNRDFLKLLDENFPHEYFDWKITVAFYCSLHMMRAYANFLKIKSAESHKEFWESLKDESIKIDQAILSSYKAIYRYCRNARYDGFINSENFDRICKSNYNHCKSIEVKISTSIKEILK